MKLLFTTTTTALLAGVALAADKNAITYPDSSLSLHLGDSVVVSYTTDYETPWMYIFCENGDALSEIIYYAPIDIAEHTSITFDLTYDYMPTGKCFFNLRSSQHVADDNTITGVVSPDFDYDKTEGDHETFSSGSSSPPSPSPSSNTTAATTTTTKNATSAVPTTTPASNSTMTTSKALVTASSSATTPAETTGGSEATSSPTSTVTLPPSGGSRSGVALGAVLIAALAVFG